MLEVGTSEGDIIFHTGPLSSTMTPFTWEWIRTKDQGYPDHTGLQGSQFTAEVQSQHAFAVLNAGADFRCAPAAFCDRASGKPSQLCVALLICILGPVPSSAFLCASVQSMV